MIPCVALAAFPGKFDVVVASDINGEAVACALGNLNIVCDSAAFAARRAQIHKSRGMNQGMDRRGAIIEAYMAELEPILMTNPTPSGATLFVFLQSLATYISWPIFPMKTSPSCSGAHCLNCCRHCAALSRTPRPRL